MTKRKIPRPTNGEMEILAALWRLGPSTVRDVNRFTSRRRPIGYTTTLKLMQIMAQKGLLERDASSRTHVYRPTTSEEGMQEHMVKDLLQKVFAGSSEKLVMRALSAKKVSPTELERIRNLIDAMEGGS